MINSTNAPTAYNAIHEGISELLQAALNTAARSVNALMTAAYWEIGRRIVENEQGGEERAHYGKELLKRLSTDLSARFGRGYSQRNLEQMRLFYLSWPISQTLSAQSLIAASDTSQAFDLRSIAQHFPLPWSAYVRLLPIKSRSARQFYETEALRCGWSVRQLNRQIDSQLYERIALSKSKAVMLEAAEHGTPNDVMTPEEAIRDPFVLEFLNLKDEYSESDLEDALIQNLADFLLELGDDSASIPSKDDLPGLIAFLVKLYCDTRAIVQAPLAQFRISAMHEQMHAYI